MKKLSNSIKITMSRWMIACDEAAYLISRRQDEKLGPFRWWSLRVHLLTCHLCRKYASQIRELDQAVSTYRHHCDSECTHHLSPEDKIRQQQQIDGAANAN